MPDISKCLNDKCPLKDECYRFTCEPSEYRQSYSRFEPIKTGHTCEWMIPNSTTLLQKTGKKE